jgi:hypothetical protein
MYGIFCEVDSCFHNVAGMCFCPVAVHLTAQTVMRETVLNCSEYQDKDFQLHGNTGLEKDSGEEKAVPLPVNEG